MTGSSLIANGLTWWQAVVAIVVGNLLAMVFVVLNSLPGAYYHRETGSRMIGNALILSVGFPVVNRYVWGLYGSQFVLWNRILLSLGMSSYPCLYIN